MNKSNRKSNRVKKEIISSSKFSLNDNKILSKFNSGKNNKVSYKEAFHETQEMYKSLILASPDAIVLLDLNLNILYTSEKTYDLLKLDKNDKIIGTNAIEFFPFDEHDRLRKSVEKALKFGLSGKIEFKILRKDKTIFIGEVSTSVVKDANGKAKALIAILRDITQNKQMEEAILASERKYRTLVDNALIGVYRTNLAGQYIYANQAMAKILGYLDANEMMKNGVCSRYKNITDREIFLNELMKNGLVRDYELELLTHTGDVKNVIVSASIEGDEISGMMLDITERKKIENEYLENLSKLKRLMESTIYAIARIVEMRDPYTAGHQQRVAQLVLAIADEITLSEQCRTGLHLAAVIHDIGKISVPSEILTRPSKLNHTEFALIKTHPQVGYEILKEIEFPWPVAEIVYQHHERIDGSGYPRGLRGDEILLEAKILAVADVVEAMLSHRPYRPSRGIEITLKEIIDNKGILYDEMVVDACIKIFKKRVINF